MDKVVKLIDSRSFGLPGISIDRDHDGIQATAAILMDLREREAVCWCVNILEGSMVFF